MITITFCFGDFVTFFRIVEGRVTSIMITWWRCWRFWWTIYWQVSCWTYIRWNNLLRYLIEHFSREKQTVFFSRIIHCELLDVRITHQHYGGRQSHESHSDRRAPHSFRHIEIHIDRLQGRNWLDHHIQDHLHIMNHLASWLECIDAEDENRTITTTINNCVLLYIIVNWWGCGKW